MSPFPKCPVCKHPHAAGTNHVWDEEKDGDATATGNTPAPEVARPQTTEVLAGADAIADGGFDRKTYQREYMRDLPKAKALGLTVKEWRIKFGGKDE